MSRDWGEKIDKFAAKIDSVYHMTNYGDITQLPWTFEDISAVLDLS